MIVNKRYIETKELANYLGVCSSTLTYRVQKGLFPSPVFEQNKNKWLVEDIIKFVENEATEKLAPFRALDSTGTGKPVSTFMANSLNFDEGDSDVVTVPKGDLVEKTEGYLRSQGFEVLILPPESSDAMTWNLLYKCKNEEEVVRMAEIIIANHEMVVKHFE